MNGAKGQPGWDDCLLYDRVLGVAATVNTFYPFDVGMAKPLEILRSCLERLLNTPEPELLPDDRSALVSAIVGILDQFEGERITPEQKSDGLLGIYLKALIASLKIQDKYGFRTPFWEKVSSRLDGAVFGWTLGWHNTNKELDLRTRIIDICRSQGVRI